MLGMTWRCYCLILPTRITCKDVHVTPGACLRNEGLLAEVWTYVSHRADTGGTEVASRGVAH